MYNDYKGLFYTSIPRKGKNAKMLLHESDYYEWNLWSFSCVKKYQKCCCLLQMSLFCFVLSYPLM